MKTVSLEDSCLKYLNHLLLVETHYGYGWSYPENQNRIVSNLEMEPIPDFSFRLWEFSSFQTDERRGGAGVIEDRNCRYNGYMVVFSTRYAGVFDFDANFPECNLSILTKEQMDSGDRKASVGGWGLVRSSVGTTTASFWQTLKND